MSALPSWPGFEPAAPRDPEDRIEALIAAAQAAPTAVEPRLELVRALLALGRAAEAVFPVEQAVALAPGFTHATELRRAVMTTLAAGDPELVRLALVCALEPQNGAAHLALGEAYATSDRPKDAERHLKLALGLGRAREAHGDLAALYLSVDMLDAAEHHARAALAFGETADQTVAAMAHQTLAGVRRARGDEAGAARELDLAYAKQSLFHQPAPGCPFTTLVLVTRENGNLPYKALLPPDRFTYLVWYMEHARAEQIDTLPPYDLVLNAIGDPDVARASAAMVDAVMERCTRPVINRPAQVAATARDRLGETLAGLEHVITPRTVRISAGDVAAGLASGRLAEHGLAAPLLVRPTGSHGGAGLILAEDEIALGAALAALSLPGGGEGYATRFHDYRSADGYYRKYRMIFVDRRPYPYHLAISRQWMVHHQSAEMAGDPGRIAEELRFLQDPAAAIGATAMAALEAIGRRLDLDYGGSTSP